MLGHAAVATVALLALAFPLLAFAVSPAGAELASPASDGFTNGTIGVGIQSTSTQAASIPKPKLCCFKFGCYVCW